MKHKVSKLVAFEPDPGGCSDDDIPSRPMSPLEAACFIEGMAAELRAMARDARLSALGYFLEMARIEASAEIERLASQRNDRH